MRFAPLLFLAACAPALDPSDDVDQGTADADEVAWPLAPGVYDGSTAAQATSAAVPGEACGTLLDHPAFQRTRFALGWLDDETFELTSAGSTAPYTLTCAIGDEGEMCGDYDRDVVMYELTLSVHANVERLDLPSEDVFTLSEQLALSCAGMGCDEFAAAYEAVLPCSVAAASAFTRADPR